MAADLHIHSTYSDGSFTPEELVEKAKDKGLTTIALADHDTVAGIEPALEAGKKYGVEVIPALEFSTFRGEAEIHILGYFIDYKDERLLNKINKIFQARIDRAQKMVELLNENGIKISYSQVKEIAGDDYIGRPHLAQAMVASGYIEEMGQAFTDDYIGNEGKAYVSKYKLKPEEAIQLIKEVGGIPVLAHPVFINHGEPMAKKGIKKLKEEGLAGLEVFHSKHDKEDTRYYMKTALDLELLITGGSDFHGENSPGVKLGDISLEEEYVEALKLAYQQQHENRR